MYRWLIILACWTNTVAAVELAVNILHVSIDAQHQSDAVTPFWMQPPADLGVAGAELGVADSNTTGKFLKHHYQLHKLAASDVDALSAQVTTFMTQHKVSALLIDADDASVLTLASKFFPDTVLFNVASSTDALRDTQCRAGLLHSLPSNAMLADGLMQYLAARRWQRLFVVVGQTPQDDALLGAYSRAAKRFGIKLQEAVPWTFTTDLRRVAQQEVATLTRAKDYDAVLVVDTTEQFGFYLPYNTYLPRPVVGTHGMTAQAWHYTLEQWGALQLQQRFVRSTSRHMQPQDYAAWIAVRAIAEAVTRVQSTEVVHLYPYLLSDAFELAAFQGRKLSFRDYNGQLRQPLALVHAQGLVSQSPQEGFLHPVSDLDTLGYDRSEVRCNMEVSQ